MIHLDAQTQNQHVIAQLIILGLIFHCRRRFSFQTHLAQKTLTAFM